MTTCLISLGAFIVINKRPALFFSVDFKLKSSLNYSSSVLSKIQIYLPRETFLNNFYSIIWWLESYQIIKNNIYYKWRLDCRVFSANRIDRIGPLLSQAHKKTQLSSNEIKIQPQSVGLIVLSCHINLFVISSFHSMFIIVNHGDRQSFCPNNSKVQCQKRTAHHTTPIFVASAFVLGLELKMDIV